MIAAIGNILSIISSIKGLADLVFQIAQGVTAWYLNNAKSEHKTILHDAIALSLSAKTDEEIAEASSKIKAALSIPRMLK